MLQLNFFNASFSKTQKRYCPGVKPMALSEESFMSIVRDPKTKELCEAFQRGDATAKTKLPAFCWTGRCKEGKTRAAANMEPTQLYMVDIDHVAEPEQMWQAIRQELINAMEQGKDYRIRLVHITPSGKGLRIVAEATQDFETLKEHMEWLCTELRLNECGDLDMCVKDLSRLSFAVPEDYILWKSPNLFNEPAKSPIKRADSGVAIPSPQDGKAEEASGDDREAHREEYEGYKSYCYKGTLLTDIIRKYLEVYGEPEQGEKHNFYNQMVKNFRCIADNNPRVLHALLPRFGGDNDFEYNKTLSQCQSICRTNTLSKLPKDFYFFLVKNGFITRRGEGTTTREATVEEVFNAPERPKVEMPKLPTIFNEFARI
ncbi:MAG: hypothetical protein KBT12_02720, partial [Bacteroidales bacterium]|nr:hypothetical protein [Candidatus Physcousia equi]